MIANNKEIKAQIDALISKAKWRGLSEQEKGKLYELEAILDART